LENTQQKQCILPLLLPRNSLLKNSIVVIIGRKSTRVGFVDFYFGRRRAKAVFVVVVVKKHTSRIDLMMMERTMMMMKKQRRTREHGRIQRRNQSASSVGAGGLGL